MSLMGALRLRGNSSRYHKAQLCRRCCRGRVECSAKDILRQVTADAARVDSQSEQQLCGWQGVWQGRGSARRRARHGAAHAVALVRFPLPSRCTNFLEHGSGDMCMLNRYVQLEPASCVSASNGVLVLEQVVFKQPYLCC